MSILSKPYFHDEAAALAKLEEIVWPKGPICPHCGNAERIYKLEGVKNKRGAVRPGLHKCGKCRKQFTVRVGTVFESSHIPLHKWLQATYLLCSSKKGISAHQLHRVMEITYKSAWFMAHRLREAMRTGDLAPFGGEGSIVESDETFFGRDYTKKPKGSRKGRGYAHKFKVLSLVDRTSGKARSFKVDAVDGKTIIPIIRKYVAKETMMVTDEAAHYRHLAAGFAGHEIVRHSKNEYGRGVIHTNTIEGYFSIFKRVMKGIYQHCSEKHLHRYLAEFDFRYNERRVTDGERAETALRGIKGKRLTYRWSDAQVTL
jgi:transposase-like protein